MMTTRWLLFRRKAGINGALSFRQRCYDRWRKESSVWSSMVLTRAVCFPSVLWHWRWVTKRTSNSKDLSQRPCSWPDGGRKLTRKPTRLENGCWKWRQWWWYKEVAVARRLGQWSTNYQVDMFTVAAQVVWGRYSSVNHSTHTDQQKENDDVRSWQMSRRNSKLFYWTKPRQSQTNKRTLVE